MSDTRNTAALRALHDFFSRFADAYAEGCVPDGAPFPCITYQPVVPDCLETIPFTARVWYRSRRYDAVAALLDAIDAAIGPGVKVPAGSGAVWIYKAQRFAQFSPVRDDPDLKCATLGLAVAANTR